MPNKEVLKIWCSTEYGAAPYFRFKVFSKNHYPLTFSETVKTVSLLVRVKDRLEFSTQQAVTQKAANLSL